MLKSWLGTRLHVYMVLALNNTHIHAHAPPPHTHACMYTHAHTHTHTHIAHAHHTTQPCLCGAAECDVGMPVVLILFPSCLSTFGITILIYLIPSATIDIILVRTWNLRLPAQLLTRVKARQYQWLNECYITCQLNKYLPLCVTTLQYWWLNEYYITTRLVNAYL